ncbi:hypothetical protein L484_001691 [Morus notabilis]|uniref:Uncharacterized protein n=1 Tax=Morus notabilis TaxID=981085 RepID=W9SP77_9ROSA|nr:hypothetical protein L484_001691 [Morus notabilis]
MSSHSLLFLGPASHLLARPVYIHRVGDCRVGTSFFHGRHYSSSALRERIAFCMHCMSRLHHHHTTHDNNNN